jgi:ribosomal protein S21
MKQFTLQSKVTKNGNVKVRIDHHDDAYPLYIDKYPNLQTKKYYTISRIDPIETDNLIPNKYKDTIDSSIREFKKDMEKNSIRIQEESHFETFIKTPELSSKKRDSCVCDCFKL